MDPMQGTGLPYPAFNLLIRQEYEDVLEHLTNFCENKHAKLTGDIGAVVIGQPGIG